MTLIDRKIPGAARVTRADSAPVASGPRRRKLTGRHPQMARADATASEKGESENLSQAASPTPLPQG